MKQIKNKLTFLVIGGDFRQNFLADRLASFGNTVYTLGLSADYPCPSCISIVSLDDMPCSPDVTVLPLIASNDSATVNAPFSENPIAIVDVCKAMKNDALIVGGKLSDGVCSIFRQHGLEYADYFTREELIIENCVPTAEGALQIAMENTPITINSSRTLILGFGRVAKATAKVFSALGSQVHIAARKRSDLAYAKTLGYVPINLSSVADSLANHDIIINTVPAVLLDSEKLMKISPDALIIDLASKPGGVDFASASELQLKVIWALSLPGKVAPVTSGNIIADTILGICCERGLCDV